jgi:hypothetical protein
VLTVCEHVQSWANALGHPDWAALTDHGERLQCLVAEIPPALWQKVQHAVSTNYQRLEARYGRPMAVAIVSAGIVGTAVPLPGTSIVAAAPLIGLAELHYRIAGGDEHEEGVLARLRSAEADIRQRGKQWIEELANLVRPRSDDTEIC